MLQQIDTAHLAALESELARVTAQRDALRDALQALQLTALAVDDYAWADAVDRAGTIRPCDDARAALQACQD